MSGAYFINSGGQVVPVDDAGIHQAQQLGWIPASPEQVENLKLEAKYGTGIEQAKTFGEGLAQTLTLGLSTHGEKSLGVNPEDIAAREKTNPFAHGLGQAVGVVAPIVATGGAAALPEAAGEGTLQTAARLSAPSLISEAGQAVGKGVEAILPKATSTLGQIGVRAAKAAASGAAEGGLYGVGHVVHESALGDPNLTAQSALNEVGLSALFAGGLMGAGGLLGGIASEAGATKLGQRVADWLPELEGSAAIRSTHAVPADIRKLASRMGEENLNKLGREGEELGILSPFSTPTRISERADEVMESAAKRQSAALDEAEVAGAKPRPISEINQRIKEEVIAPLEESPIREGAAATIGKYLDKWESRLGEEGKFGLRDLHQLRMDVDADIRGLRGAFDPTSSYVKSALYDTRKVLADEINKSLEGVPTGASAWKEANRTYHVASTIGELAERGAARMHANNPISLLSHISGVAGFAAHGLGAGALAGLATEGAKRFGAGLAAGGLRSFRQYVERGAAETLVNKTAELISQERAAGGNAVASASSSAPETVAALSQLEAVNVAMRKRLDSLLDVVVRGGSKAAAGTVAHSASGLVGFGGTPQAQMEKVQQLVNNPEMLQEHLIQHTQDLQEHAPKVSQAFQVTAARALSHLSQTSKPIAPRAPLAPRPVMGGQEKWEWKRKMDAINRPTDILKHVARGTLTPIDVQAVKEVFPELHQEMVTRIADKLTQHKDTIPYQTRLMLSMLTGMDLDGSMGSATLQANQLIYSLPSAKGPESKTGPGAARTSQTGLSHLTLSSRTKLPGQASESRREG
jgi:hypothetical protein